MAGVLAWLLPRAPTDQDAWSSAYRKTMFGVRAARMGTSNAASPRQAPELARLLHRRKRIGWRTIIRDQHRSSFARLDQPNHSTALRCRSARVELAAETVSLRHDPGASKKTTPQAALSAPDARGRTRRESGPDHVVGVWGQSRGAQCEQVLVGQLPGTQRPTGLMERQ